MLVLTTVKIKKYLFLMNNCSIKASQNYINFYQFALRSFVNFDPVAYHIIKKYNWNNQNVSFSLEIIVFWCAHLATYIFLSFQLNEPGLGARTDPSMALTSFPSSIWCDLNPGPSNHEWLEGPGFKSWIEFANH